MLNVAQPNALPILRWRPPLVVGIPVARAMRLFALLTPNARFQENERPGMPVFVPFRFAIVFDLIELDNRHGIIIRHDAVFLINPKSLAQWL